MSCFSLIVFVKFMNHLFKVCDIFWLSLFILQFSWMMIVLAVLTLLEKRRFTVFQNFLVSVILLEFKLLKYCCLAFLIIFVHLFHCFLQFCKFTQVPDLLNLLRNFDLVMISFLGLFVIKGLFMYLIFFVYKDQNV